MQLIHFPAARVIEINAFILNTEPGSKAYNRNLVCKSAGDT